MSIPELMQGILKIYIYIWNVFNILAFFKILARLTRFSPQPASDRAGLVKSWPEKIWVKVVRPILTRIPNDLGQTVSQLYPGWCPRKVPTEEGFGAAAPLCFPLFFYIFIKDS